VQIIIVLALVFALFISIFAVQNATPVDIKFLKWSYSGISLVVIILGSFGLGVLLTLLFNAIKSFQNMIKLKELKDKLHHLTQENQRLKAEVTEAKSAAASPDNFASGK